jgi:hypothetical protein
MKINLFDQSRCPKTKLFPGVLEITIPLGIES